MKKLILNHSDAVILGKIDNKTLMNNKLSTNKAKRRILRMCYSDEESKNNMEKYRTEDNVEKLPEFLKQLKTTYDV